MKYTCERRQMMCHSLWISDGHFNPSIFQKIIFFFWWTIFKVFLEFVTILLLFYVLVSWLSAVWDLRHLTGDWTCRPSIGRWSLNHWTTRNVSFHPFLSASYCIDIPNILWLCFFFFKWPPNADQDGFLFSSFSAYKSREVRGTEWRPNGCKLAEHPLQEKMQDIHAPYCYFGRNPLCHWTCCRLLSPWTNWQSRKMQLFASIWERGKDTFLRLR